MKIEHKTQIYFKDGMRLKDDFWCLTNGVTKAYWNGDYTQICDRLFKLKRTVNKLRKHK